MSIATLHTHTIHLNTLHGIDPEWEPGECQLVAETASGDVYTTVRIFSSTEDGLDALRAAQAGNASLVWVKGDDPHRSHAQRDFC